MILIFALFILFCPFPLLSDSLVPPKFDAAHVTTFTGNEGEPLRIPLSATANPMVMSFTWTKDGLPITAASMSGANSGASGGGSGMGQRIISEGPVLNISKLSRNDAGSYICEAMNSQGSATIEVHVIVECKCKYLIELEIMCKLTTWEWEK